jgi:hypothetical protein
MMRGAAGIKPGFVHIRAFRAGSSASVHRSCFIVIARLDRATQYSRALEINPEAAAYWILRWSLSSGSPKARPGGGV